MRAQDPREFDDRRAIVVHAIARVDEASAAGLDETVPGT
jgi:hypothetical protein